MSPEVFPERVGVAIVGGGVAGLSAAWRLRRAGYRGRVVIFELADRIGGTSASGSGAAGPHPLGAHYITLPSPECTHVRLLLHELGVITDWVGGGPFDGGRPRYDATALCLAPQERLWYRGEWIEGLFPSTGASAEDLEQHGAFEAAVEAWRSRVGADGKPAFAIPVAHSSRDPEIRALAGLSFEGWLGGEGFDSERLRWWLEYAMRDDYGTRLHDTSAWAGLHYFASRRPDPADATDLGTHVLTWPSGNGWLVDRLAEAVDVELSLGVVVRRLEAEEGRLWVDEGGATRLVQADQIVAAVPAAVLEHLTERPSQVRPETTPWWVGQLHLDALPSGRGVSHAWDSVVYGARGLGVVSSAHQAAGYGGPTVLSWYLPLSDEAPGAARRAMMSAEWAPLAELALRELEPGFPGLRRHLAKLDVWAWGHGTVRPEVGLHTPGVLAPLAEPVGRIWPAHTDLSGLSLFEEASWQGVRAAESVLAELGSPVERSWL